MTDVESGLPAIAEIDTDALETVETPAVRIWFENGAKIQVIEDDLGSLERQWFGPDHMGEPAETEVVGDATNPDHSLADVGLETVADYVDFDDESDARDTWGDEAVDIFLGR